MFDLFGSELPLAARFFIAFLVVLALIGLTAWVVRRFGANRLGGAGARGRQPRLAVIDAASVDGRRRLVLIRRDNIEHLLMIGGPTDVVIEPNIVRATGARETPREAMREPVRPAVAPEPTMRPAASAETAWPLQPASEPPPVAAPRPYRAPASDEPWLPPEPGARPRPADSLTGLAAELSTKLTPPEPETPPAERPEPRLTIPSTPAEPAPTASADHNLSEMAQQLEAALRRTPLPEGRPPVTDPMATQAHAPSAPTPPRPEPRVEPKFESKFEPRPEPRMEARPEPKVEPRVEPKFESKPEPKLEAKPGTAPDKSLYDNLEEEMASLLGRPSGKS